MGSGRPVTTRFRQVVPVARPTWLLASLADRLISPNGSFTMDYRGHQPGTSRVYVVAADHNDDQRARLLRDRLLRPPLRSAWRLAVTTSPW
jgi:hypothetical protein